MKELILVVGCLLISISVIAQTCCSGGVPLSSNIGFSSSGQGAIQLAFAFEQNNLKTLYSESDILEFNNRERLTKSFLARIGYGLSDRFSIEALIPYINQVRNITQNNGSLNNESTSGIGDVVLLAKLDLSKSISWGINIGAGIKLPTGSTSQENSQGLLIVNDLQPGSGSLDVLGRISILHNLGVRPSMSVYSSAIWNLKGTDNEYLGSQLYRFGSELQIIAGISDQIIIGNQAIYPNLNLRYRNATRDQIDHNEINNTGGEWVFARAGIGADVYGNHRISLSLETPIYTNVDGTQLSPDLIFNITYSTFFTPSTSPSIIINQ